MLKRVTTDNAPPAMPAEWRRQQRELMAEAHQLYETYGKPLEQEHWGKYVAISRDGRTLLGDTSLEVLERATDEFGLENFVFKVGEIAVGKIR